MRPVFSKASALWNRVKRSPKVEEKLGIGSVTPNDTRWKSMFLSMQRLSKIATMIPQASLSTDPEYDRILLHTVCDVPLACPLNILQGEKNTLLGFLAPTSVQLKNYLNGLLDESFEPTATQGLIACRPLIQNMIQSLPAFKMDWVEDEMST